MTNTIEDLSKKMRDIDFTMLVPHTEDGAIGVRPMSNNREVDYDGDSWFFTADSAVTVSDLAENPSVTLNYQGSSGGLGQRPFFLAVEEGGDGLNEQRRHDWFYSGLLAIAGIIGMEMMKVKSS